MTSFISHTLVYLCLIIFSLILMNESYAMHHSGYKHCHPYKVKHHYKHYRHHTHVRTMSYCQSQYNCVTDYSYHHGRNSARVEVCTLKPPSYKDTDCYVNPCRQH